MKYKNKKLQITLTFNYYIKLVVQISKYIKKYDLQRNIIKYLIT